MASERLNVRGEPVWSVNEIVSNSYKYGFPGQRSGEIRIRMWREDKTVTLDITDNGIGLPEGFSVESSESLGMQLIQALTSQLDGELSIGRENGTRFTVKFPYPKG